MKKILFDLTKIQPVNGSKYHGGGKYGVEVFKKLTEMSPNRIVGYYDEKRYISPMIKALCEQYCIPLINCSEKTIADAIEQTNACLYSPLFDSAYYKIKSNNIIVMTIHDMRPLEMVGDLYEKYYKHPRKLVGRLLMMLGLNNLRQHFIQKRKYAEVLRQQRKIFEQPNFRIVTVSEHSKMAMMSFIPSLKMNDVQVFYSPSTVDEKLHVPPQNKEYGKYYLIVSGNRWLKNSVRAIIAFDQLFTDRPNFKGRVVITGLTSFNQITLKIKNKNRFKCVGYVDEIELASLYQNAYALIYPSLNEGFGYPPLEAMYRGCPVIASATASITEICGDSVIYFNPYLIKEIQMRVLSLENVRLRDYIIKKGKEREHLIRIKQKRALCDLCKYILSLGEQL